jgi:hypothetical protein
MADNWQRAFSLFAMTTTTTATNTTANGNLQKGKAVYKDGKFLINIRK